MGLVRPRVVPNWLPDSKGGRMLAASRSEDRASRAKSQSSLALGLDTRLSPLLLNLADYSADTGCIDQTARAVLLLVVGRDDSGH